MGTLTCTQFITELTFELGQRGDVTTYDDSWINQGYYWLTSRRDLHFPELEWKAATSVNTADGVAYIDTTSDMLYVQGLFDTTNSRYLDPIKPKKYFEYTDRADTSAEDQPTEWVHVSGGSNRGYIYLHPTPDSIYAMTRYYRALPSALSGANTTVIGTEWDEVIVRASVWIGKKRLRYPVEEVREEKKILDSLVADIKGLYDLENLDVEEKVQPDPAWILSQKR